MKKEDIQLLFGVQGGGSLSGDSGRVIKEQLSSIIRELNAKPFKIKVQLDTELANKNEWVSQLQSRLDQISNSNRLKIRIPKIDIGSGAITDFKNQLQSVLKTNNIDNSISTQLTSENASKIKSDMSSVGNSASEATRKMAEFNVQMEILGGQRSSIKKSLFSLENGTGSEEEKARISDIISQYEQWAVKIESIKASKTAASSETQRALASEGDAIRNNINAILESRRAAKDAASAQQKEAAKEAAANKDRAATINEVVNAYRKIDNYIKKNPRAENSPFQYDQLVSMRDELYNIWKNSKNAARGISDINKTDLRNILNNFAKVDEKITEAGNKGNTFTGVLMSAYQKFGGWMFVTRSLTSIAHGFRKMIDNVTELNAAMTELRKVTDETRDTYNEFFTQSSSRAKDLGATLADTISATADFARLGYTLQESSDLADTALVYKNVGDGIEDVGEASESVISTMKAFGIEASKSMGIVDKFNEVGNNFAISSSGVGKALLNSASALAAANNDLDQSIALVTAANSVIQNPEKVGTALKTVSMYLRAAKTAAEEEGLITDGMATSVSKLRDELFALTNGKVDIQIDEDNFKSTYQILKELSEVWNELTDITQANILERIGGKRNSNVVSALLSNFDIADEVLATTADSAGSALAENEKYLDSINGKAAQFQAQFEALSSAVINSELVKGVYDTGTGALGFFTELVELLGSIPTIAGVAAAALSFKNVGISNNEYALPYYSKSMVA